MHNDLKHRKLFHKIHLKLQNTKHIKNIENSFHLNSFKLKNYQRNFENKIVAVFGSGSLSLEAKFFLKNNCKFCYIIDLDKSIQLHSNQILKNLIKNINFYLSQLKAHP